MTIAERITAAFKGDEVDYTPCVPVFWEGHPQNQAFTWKDGAERLSFYLEQLGVDTVSYFRLSHKQPPFQSWTEHVPGERYPMLHSEIDTPKGKLRAIIKKTSDYRGSDVPFFSDWTVSRFVRPWIETMEDVEKFASIYLPPDDAQLAAAKGRLERIRFRSRLSHMCM